LIFPPQRKKGPKMLINIIAILILICSVMSGFFQGAIKTSFAIVSYLIALPIAGYFYPFVAGILSFLPGEDWENLLGFIIVLCIFCVILHFVFWLPRKILEKIIGKGLISRFAGSFISLISAGIGLTVFALLIQAFPVWAWLQMGLDNSAIINLLVSVYVLVQGLLPEIMRTGIFSSVSLL
jgi:uncharacterized membrane protein required for colicin V production